MSLRLRRALLGLVIAAAVLAALPATALAAGEKIDVSPSDAQAGGSPSITTTLEFASGDAPNTVVTNLAPGLLSNLNANPSCLAGSQQLTPACQIGNATITAVITGTTATVPATGNLYLGPAPVGSGDVARIDVHITSPTTQDQFIDVSFNPSSPGGLTLTSANLPNTVTIGTSTIPIQIQKIETVFNPALNGQPFNRLPTNCSAATSTMSVTYDSGATGSASASFMPTGCASLPYGPNLTAAIGVDSSNGGAELKTDVTQAANEAASKAITITFPSGLTPNLAALIPCLTGTPCTIGTATATSPLVPGTLNGTLTLGGSAAAPTFTITFPAPFNLTISGVVNLSNNSVTFSNVPDIPLTNLSLDVTGPSGGRAFITDCKPASIRGSFTAQSGKTNTATAPIAFNGQCPSSPGTGTGTGTGTGAGTGPSSPPASKHKPKASGSITGLATGHPRLKFHVTDAGGAKITSVAVGLPGGLKFSRAAFVSHKVCTKKGGKKTCKTTKLIKGLRISGGKAKTVAIKGGRLVITLKKAAASISITAAGPLVSESKSLRTKVKKHKVKTMRFALKVTTANHARASLTLKLKAH